MDNKAIMFRFADARSALDAYDTLAELGYDPVLHELEREQPHLHIHLDRSDLTSALEIAQAHGGRLIEEDGFAGEAFTNAYGLDRSGITIPAHVVNEDWPEWYADADGATGLSANRMDYDDAAGYRSVAEAEAAEEAREVEWGAGSGTDHMSGDVHA